jgi:hypothetical protein
MQEIDERDARDHGVPETTPNAPAPWPSGMPYTLLFPTTDGEDYVGADLEHPAPLPRIGDTLEYIDEAGGCHRYRVREVIHTIQSSAAQRRSVREGCGAPEAIARPGDRDEAERPGTTGIVRAGLPKVLLEEVD